MRDLAALEKLARVFTPEAAEKRLRLLARLERARLGAATQIERLHELLCWSRAYPDSPAVLEAVERMLAAFERRPDLKRFRRDLMDTGIAGTDIYFRFYWLMAERLVARWPDALTIDWEELDHGDELLGLLDLLVPYAETPALDGLALEPREWLERMKGPDETDAAFLVRRFQAFQISFHGRETVYDALDVPMRLAPGPDTPCRTKERWPDSPVLYQEEALDTRRPDLKRVARETRVTITELQPHEGRAMIALANDAMVARHRDLLVFLHGDENDVRVIDCGDGIQFACIGAMPDRRLVLEAVYGFLTLRNGVPVGYVLNSALFGSCELAYNVFPTFRGGESALVYGKFLAAVVRVFGADSFTVDPYQLGHDNKEGQQSGAWWFYYKLGFRPRDAAIKKLVREELGRIARNPRYRTPPERIDALAADNVYLSFGKPRRDVLGRISLGNIGLHASHVLATRFGSAREEGIQVCAEEVARVLGLKSLRALTPGERIAWERWAPLLLAIPDLPKWPTADRRAAAEVVRAKGGRRESDFVRRLDTHPRLRQSLQSLARRPPPI